MYTSPLDTSMGFFMFMFVGIFIISMMIISYQNTSQMDQNLIDILKEKKECPECPKCPDCGDKGECPKCPDLTCPESKECPPCEKEECNCPTVDDIVTGIFPGRNPGITSGGKYFDVKANESYELLPDYDFYQPEDAFKEESILEQPVKDKDYLQPKNTIDNNLANTLPESSNNRQQDLDNISNMSMGMNTDDDKPTQSTGNNTSKVNNSTRSKDPS